MKTNKYWVKIIGQSKKAYMVIQLQDLNPVWLGKKQIKLGEQRNGFVQVTIPKWMEQNKYLNRFFVPEDLDILAEVDEMDDVLKLIATI